MTTYIQPFRVTVREARVSFPSGAPDITGVSTGLRELTVSPVSVRVKWTDGRPWRIEVTGHKRLKSGKLSVTEVQCIVGVPDAPGQRYPGSSTGYPVAPEWLLAVIDCVTAGADA